MTLEQKYPKVSLKLFGAAIRVVYQNGNISGMECIVQNIDFRNQKLIVKTPVGKITELSCINHGPKNVKFEVVKYRSGESNTVEDLLILLDILEERYTKGSSWK